jgi:hypothetical protein
VVNISEGIERPSPDLVDVIEQLARDLHPEAFAADENRKSPGWPDTFYAQNEAGSAGAGSKPDPACSGGEIAACAR